MAELSIQFTVKGIEELEALGNASTAFTDAINQTLEDLRSEIEDITTSLCPVDTGALRDSIDISLQDFTINCEAGEDYASFVDGGTRFMDAEPFFENPINDAFEGLQDELEDAINTALEDL